MKANTFEAFCKQNHFDLDQFPELKNVLFECYRQYRAGATMTTKDIDRAIKQEKQRLAQLQAAPAVSVADLVTADLRSNHKRMGA